MRFLALSGSTRAASTNTALLHALANAARPEHGVTVFSRLGDLPVFSPDLETGPLPPAVQGFVDLIRDSDGIVISSPEYVRAIPGGLKNAIDWLVSRDEVILTPIALIHASHRGDDMLDQLRLVLSTVTQRFARDLFLRVDLMGLTPEQAAQKLAQPEPRAALADFAASFAQVCRS